MMWDQGTWTPEVDPASRLTQGASQVHARTARSSRARWHLVRMRPQAAREERDLAAVQVGRRSARQPGDPDIPPRSRRRRDRARIEAIAPKPAMRAGDHKGRANRIEAAQAAAPRHRQPSWRQEGILPPFVEPSLADAQRDGAERCRLGARDQARRLSAAGAHRRTARCKLLTRQGARLDRALRPRRERARRAAGSVGADRRRGRRRRRRRASRASAMLVRSRSRATATTCCYYAFDLLYLDGFDLSAGSAGRTQGGACQAARSTCGRPGRLSATASISRATATTLVSMPAGSASKASSPSEATRPTARGAARTWLKSKCTREPGVRRSRAYVPSTCEHEIGRLAGAR